MKIVKMEAFEIIGISTRTTNAAEMGGAAKISNLWGQFFSEQLMTKIPQVVGSEIVAVYHNYESDSSGAYSVLVGMKVAPGTATPTGMEHLSIPGQNYSYFVTNKGPMPGVVVETWQKVWNLEKTAELPRKYSFDLEVYTERSMNPESAEVDIYIARKD